MGLKISFGSSPRGLRDPSWFNKGWILTLSVLQEVLYRTLEVLSWG